MVSSPGICLQSTAPHPLDLGAISLRPEDSTVWLGHRRVRLRPKTFAVAATLIGRPGELVRKDDLLDAVWGDAETTDTVLKVCVRELRTALGDVRPPFRTIETVHRQGYRFVPGRPGGRSFAPPLIGKHDSLTLLNAALDGVMGGSVRAVDVRGEAGSGKSVLTEAFASRVREQGHSLLFARCVRTELSGEPYLPIELALSRLAGESPAASALLVRLAPTWAVGMPTVRDASMSRALLHRRAARRPAVGELIAWLEDHSRKHTVILVVEDLDSSTPPLRDLLALVVGSRIDARLLVVTTRRGEGREGTVRWPASVVRTRRWTEAETAEFLERYPFPTDPWLVTLLHRRSGGVPGLHRPLVEALDKLGAGRVGGSTAPGRAEVDRCLERAGRGLLEAQSDALGAGTPLAVDCGSAGS
jgi:hypothetical protein